MTLEEMTLEDALDMVLRQAEKSECNVKALEMVEDAVLRYMKIQKEFNKLQDIIKKKDEYRRVVTQESECIYPGFDKCNIGNSDHE